MLPHVYAGVCVAIYALALAVPTLPSSDGEPTLPGNTGVAAGTPYAREGVGGRRRLLTACAANYRVDNNNTCVACATGSVNDAGDDSSGSETDCTCPVDFRVDSLACVSCAGGSARAGGDNPLVDGDTDCGCAIDERVVDNVCTACPAGTTNAAGDDPLGVDTECDPVLCLENFRVNDAHTCVACATGSVNDAGDDSSGSETDCTCPVDFRVQSLACVSCAGRSARAGGDNPLVDGDTDCGCAIDERVVDNVCTACPAGTTNAAGDDPLGVDTVCEPVAYVELLVVNDKARCDAFASVSGMHAHTAAVVASVGTIFATATGFPTKTRVVLAGQVDWCGDGDDLDATYFIPATHEDIERDGYPTAETDADALLLAFGIWRDVKLDTIAKNDVAHLFTGRDLTANSVGGAYQYSACSDDSSYCGATNPEDPSESLCVVTDEGGGRCRRWRTRRTRTRTKPGTTPRTWCSSRP
jgi:hypothetical protein